MSLVEKLMEHSGKLKEIQTRLAASQQAWEAYNKNFLMWLSKELDIKDGDTTEYHLADLIVKAIEKDKNDNASKLIL